MKNAILIFTALLVIGCHDTVQKPVGVKKETQSRYLSLEQIAEYKQKCVTKGDIYAFRILVDNYGNTPSENFELLPLAMIMADKYNCDIARSTIYFSFLDIQNQGRDEKAFFKLEKVKQDFIVKYLVDGAKNNNIGCLSILNNLLKNGLKMDRDKKNQINESYKKAKSKIGLN